MVAAVSWTLPRFWRLVHQVLRVLLLGHRLLQCCGVSAVVRVLHIGNSGSPRVSAHMITCCTRPTTDGSRGPGRRSSYEWVLLPEHM
jgi:hypothetical protein